MPVDHCAPIVIILAFCDGTVRNDKAVAGQDWEEQCVILVNLPREAGQGSCCISPFYMRNLENPLFKEEDGAHLYEGSDRD